MSKRAEEPGRRPRWARRGRLLLGLGLCAAGLSTGALGALWIASSSYRRARYARVLEQPAELATVSPLHWAFALVVAVLVITGLVVAYGATRER